MVLCCDLVAAVYVGEDGSFADVAAQIEVFDDGSHVASREVDERAAPGNDVCFVFILEVVMIGFRERCLLVACW